MSTTLDRLSSLVVSLVISLVKAVLIVSVAAVTTFASTEPAAAQASTVTITEIHYHPQEVGENYPDFDDREDTEFIELANLGTQSIDVGGWCFNAGIDYCFAAGTSIAPNAVVVLARDTQAFSSVYNRAADGEYSGRLSNSGEFLRLQRANGTVQAVIAYDTGNSWPVTPDGDGPSLELVSETGVPGDPANWQASSAVNGTPGTVSSLQNGPLPLVVSRTAPEIVTAGSAVPVRVQARNTTSATVLYQIDQGSQQQQPMTLQNSEWTATLPSLGAGSIVRWRVQLSGPNGVSTSPRPDDSITNWATVVPSQPVSAVPVVDLYFTSADWIDVNNNLERRPAVVAFDGQVWTDVMVRRAGFTSLQADKANLRLDFPTGHPFDAGFATGPVDVVTLDAGNTNRDQLIESLSWTLAEQAGFAPIQNQHVRVHRDGSFYGLHLMREEQDGDWRGRYNFDRGSFYKAEPPANLYSVPSNGTGPANFGFRGHLSKKEGLDQSDQAISDFRGCLDQTGAAGRECLLDQADIAQLANEFATIMMVRQGDQREFNWFIYRDDAENGLWRMQPDDLDRVMGFSSNVSNLGGWNRCIGNGTELVNEPCRAFMRVPEFEEMYNRRLRTLVDEVLSQPGVHIEIDRLASLIATDWNDDNDKWDRTTTSLESFRSGLNTWVDAYVAHQRSGGHDGKVPGAQSTNPTIRITSVQPGGGTGASWVIVNNPSSSESVDISDWTLTGFAPIAKGTVVLPGASIAIVNDDATFRAANPNFAGIRSYAQGSAAGLVSLGRRNGTVADTFGVLPSSELILNEWNAVSATNTLVGSDPTFGTVPGNGGDWFELVVTADNLDIRGWKLVLSDSDGGPLRVRDSFEFSNDPLLASLRAGTIITIAEEQPDDASYDPVRGDWHVNFQSNSADAGRYLTAATQENFAVNGDDWRLAIFDDTDNLIFGPAGEGIGTATGITADEVGELEADPSATINPATDFGDGNDSTFGLPNVFNGQTQDFDTLRPTLGPLGDVNCDGVANVIDALFVSQYDVFVRPPAPNGCSNYDPTTIALEHGDTNNDGTVDVIDALFISQCDAFVSNVLCPDV